VTPFIRDDFAGPGGWSEALRLLGFRETVGLEFEPHAVATARLAGHSRWLVDVRSDECRNYAWPPMWLYIASPPCQTFSMAGKGAGREHLAALIKALHLVAGGMTPEQAIAEVADEALDERSVLVLEPMFVIRRHGPLNVAMEQVPPVLPIWMAYADVLASWGYSVWSGMVHSEQYGVPQTRKRAVLIASRQRQVSAPVPTHSKFHSHSPAKLDDGVLPWISMAQALSWGMTQRPSMTVTGGGTTTGGAEVFGNAARKTIQREAQAGRWALRGNQKPNGVDYQRRSIENPAQTITGETGSFQWVPEAPNGGDTSWSERRPAPTIIGSYAPEIVAAPKYRKAGDGPRQNAPGSIRVTVEEAGILQSFPVDYPWQGTKGKQFEQVGNAVPPVMAAAVLAALLGVDAPALTL
jgi:DNA (cytosine-5)-methyltransferase 1